MNDHDLPVDSGSDDRRTDDGGPDLSDLEPASAERLTGLLHRAADGLHVRAPDALPGSTVQRGTRGRRGSFGRVSARRGLLAAACLVVLAGVAGVWWVDRAGRDEPLEAGPSVLDEQLRTVTEQTGIWRLPNDDAEVRVTSASEVGWAPPPMLMVDDVENPTRWLMLVDRGSRVVESSTARKIELDDGLVLTLEPAEDGGPASFALAQGQEYPMLSGRFQDVDEQVVVEFLRDLFFDATNLTDERARRHVFAKMDAPDGLVATWDRQTIESELAGEPIDGPQSIELTAIDEDGSQVMVSLQRTGLPPAVAMLSLELTYLELMSWMDDPGSSGAALETEIVRRPDLGRWVLDVRSSIDGRPAGAGALTLVVFTEDGTTITANRVATAADLLDATPLPESEQLRIIASLRAMDERAFRDELTRRDAEWLDSGSEVMAPSGATTTVVGEPEDPGP